MHISYNGKTGRFAIEDIERSLFRELVMILDASHTSPKLRVGLYDIRDDIEMMGVATLDDSGEYVWTPDGDEQG